MSRIELGRQQDLDRQTLLDLATLPATIDTEVAAKILGVSPQSVRTLCSHAEFDCFRVGAGRSGGGPWRIVTADLLRYCNLTEHVDAVRRAIEHVEDARDPLAARDDRDEVLIGAGRHGRA